MRRIHDTKQLFSRQTSKVFKTFEVFTNVLCVVLCTMFLGGFCEAASSPLPQQIIGEQLQRDDCVSNAENPDTPFTAYIQEFLFTDTKAGISLYSCVNWRDGFLKSEGVGKNGSRRAAELVARGNALKTLLVVNLDSRFTLHDYFTRQSQIRLKIQNVLIKDATVEELPSPSEHPDDAVVLVTIPFYGISGLTSFLIDDQELYLEPPTAPDIKTPQSGEYTGILVDVRGVERIQPALLPKILSEEGEIVYEASQVAKEVLHNEGMVHYVSESADSTSWRAGIHPFVVKPILLASAEKYPQLFAQTRKRRGQENTLTVEATNSSGDIPVNVIVSVEDAKKIKQLNEANQFDQQGSYTILIGGEIGGVKGLYPDGIFVMR